MKIPAKIMTMACSAIVLLVILGASSLSLISQVFNAASDTRSVWLPRTQMLDGIQFTMLRYHTTTIRKVLAVDLAEIQGLDDEFVEMDAAIPTSLSNYAATITTDAERTLWTDYTSRWQAYQASRQPILDALAKGDQSAATAAVAPAREPLVAGFVALGKVIAFNEAGAGAAAQSAADAYHLAWLITTALAVVGLPTAQPAVEGLCTKSSGILPSPLSNEAQRRWS